MSYLNDFAPDICGIDNLHNGTENCIDKCEQLIQKNCPGLSESYCNDQCSFQHQCDDNKKCPSVECKESICTNTPAYNCVYNLKPNGTECSTGKCCMGICQDTTTSCGGDSGGGSSGGGDSGGGDSGGGDSGGGDSGGDSGGGSSGGGDSGGGDSGGGSSGGGDSGGGDSGGGGSSDGSKNFLDTMIGKLTVASLLAIIIIIIIMFAMKSRKK